MGKEHKKHKKHKHSKSKHKSKDDHEYHVPIVPLKSDVRPKSASTADEPTKDTASVKPIGPILPSGLSGTVGGKHDETAAPGESNHSYGPSLPPHLVPQKRAPGPSLPLDFKIEESVVAQQIDDDISGFGPLPAELITSDSEQLFIQKQLELRAEYMKRKFAGEVYDDVKQETVREKWMLELPPEKAANLGLGARQFRKREAPDMSNRSEWTDTPSDKERKVQEPKTADETDMEALKMIAIQKRDEQMEKLAETSVKRKPYSLLEMHQEKLKKQKKEKIKEGPVERRPFSREIDLQCNKFDDAQKQSILKKASQLNNRFSQGESRFL
ncbi:GPALPP motifs-containing protein 1 [Rhopalosiphum maidis]|uniref:GPALPP motifs-containing protein 1 n=1 Tax=Rhopalosiphum maidis TaxID=43146 RepID=UPI000F005D16|nr:GPALPP motifs-containing protein 1 [Rhopalosiphum maidis]